MNAAEQIGPTISEPLTWAQICERYPDQWVCLVEIDRVKANNFEFRAARVVGHGKTRREPLEQSRPWRAHYETIGHYFTGPIDASPPTVRVKHQTDFDVGLTFLRELNYEIRSAEGRIVVEKIAP